MSNVIHSKNVNVMVRIGEIDTYLGCAFSSVFEFENEIILKTDVNAGLFRKKRVRMSDTRATIGGVMTTGGGDKASVFYFLQEGVRRSELDFKFLYVDDNGSDVLIEMTALVRSCTLNADISNFAEYDLQLEGTGAIVIGTIEPPEPSECHEIKSDYWTTTPGESSITGASANNVATTLAGKTIIGVDREGLGLIPTTGTPGNGEYRYTGDNLIEVDPTNPFNADETMFVIWSES